MLLATAAYYLGIGDANTVNKLAQWAYYALARAVLALLADVAIPADLKLFKKGPDYTVDVEVLKKGSRELVEREPSFLRDLFLDALRFDGCVAEAMLDLFTKHPEARLKLAQAVAGSFAVPLNVATKDDIKS